MPFSASASSWSISARVNATPSAVPCTSTKWPAPVITTFMSVSQSTSSTYSRSSSGVPCTMPTEMAATGLDHVAIELDGALAQQLEVKHRAQAAADKALDLLRAAGLLAARGLAVAAGVGGAGQHAVFGRDPALAAAALVGRHALFHRSGAKHFGVAELDQHRALGMHGVAAGDAHGAQLVGGAVAGAGESGHRIFSRKMGVPHA